MNKKNNMNKKVKVVTIRTKSPEITKKICEEFEGYISLINSHVEVDSIDFIGFGIADTPHVFDNAHPELYDVIDSKILTFNEFIKQCKDELNSCFDNEPNDNFSYNHEHINELLHQKYIHHKYNCRHTPLSLMGEMLRSLGVPEHANAGSPYFLQC